MWINTLKLIFASLSQGEDTLKLNSEESFQSNMEAILLTDRIKDYCRSLTSYSSK